MDEENVFLVTLCRRLFSCNVLALGKSKKQRLEFEKKYCFRPQMQPFFTATGLSALADAAGEGTFYVLSDKLHLAITLFVFRKQTFLIGPYALTPLTPAAIEKDTEGIPLSLSERRLLYIYCSAFPVLDPAYVTDTVQSILSSLDPSSPIYTARNLKGFFEDIEKTDRLKSEDADEKRIAAIREKYAFENRLLDYIRHGETEKALSAFRHMTKEFSDRRPSSMLPVYQNPLVSVAILRALWRKAAEEGGLSVIVIDALTQLQAQQSYEAASMKEQIRSMDRLLRDLCDSVRDVRQETDGCSPATKKVLEYIFLHLADDIRLEDLVALTGYSRSHISAAFREDTGRTISAYIAEKRCEKAAELLSSTSLSIQDIALRVGYPDNNYFVKVFKKQVGMTPSELRRKKENGKKKKRHSST